MKSLLIAVALCIGANASSQVTTTLAEYGTSDVPWSETNAADWTTSSNYMTKTLITEGLMGKNKNGTEYLRKTISPSENVILNISAEFNLFSNTGRNIDAGTNCAHGSFFRFGNIYIIQNSQNQASYYSLTNCKAKDYTYTQFAYSATHRPSGYGATKTDGSASDESTFSAEKFQTMVKSAPNYYVEMEINTATNTLTSLKVYPSSEKESTLLTLSNQSLTDADYTTLEIGFLKGSSMGCSSLELLKSLKVTQTTQAVSTASYTVKYLCGGDEIKDADATRSGVVDGDINLTASDRAAFYNEGRTKKYIYVSDDASSKTIASDGSTVVTVTFREAESWNYTVNAMNGESKIEELTTGSTFEQENVTVPFHKYYNVDGTLYQKSANSNEYRQVIKVDENNKVVPFAYTASEKTNVVFFKEAEDIETLTAVEGGGTTTRCSLAKGAYSTEEQVVATLAPGIYKLWGAGYGGNLVFKAGETVVLNMETQGYWREVASEKFTITENTDITFKGGASGGNASLDYVIIQKTGDVTVPVSGLADGEYVYTPQGRFQITGDVIARSNFYDFSGWEVITAIDDKEVVDNFAIDTENGPADGVFYAVSLDDTAGEGMYFKFTPTDAGATYVVSYKMKGAQAVTTRVKTVAVSTNLVKVEGNSDGVYGGTNDVLLCNTAEELSDEWQTFNYAIVGDGVPRTYFISFSGMSDNIYIADLQIAEAYQVADLRARDAALERVNVYKNAYAWSEEDLNDFGIYDALEILNAIGDQSSQAALNDALEAANEILNEFRYSNMDDYLAGGDERNYLSNTFGVAGDSETSSYGVWNCIPSGRGHWAANAYPDMGHYQNGTTWNNGAPTTAQGVTTQMELTPGSYVFAIKSAAALREPQEQTWHTDDGMKPAYGIAYIAKVNGETVDIIASSEQKDLEPVKMTPFYVTANITEAGKYEFGMLAYCKEAYQSLELGSVTYVGDASIVGKSYSKYTQKQLAYEKDVREQITTGREQLNIAAAYLADEEKLWGKDELQACVNTVSPKIAAYETLTQDDIIATYEDYYEKTISNDNGLMVYMVYVEAVKDIIAANRRFDAVNSVVPVTITSAGWATLYTPYAIDFSTVEGLEAYTATMSDNTVTLSKVNNVPAGTGVVLKGEAKDYNIPVTANSETEKGSLEGSATEATAYDAFSGYKLYMLKKVGDNVQFVPMTSGSLAKGKAYLKIAQDNAGSGEAKALSVVFVNEPTGIKSVNSDETKVNGIYDLQGRRVSQPTKGLYIVNGKKVVIK